jgi:hypothetical protein
MASILHAAGDVADGVDRQFHHATRKAGKEFETTANRIVPPKRREQMLENFRHYARHNPKTAVCPLIS